MTIGFVPRFGAHVVIGVSGGDRVAIHLGDRVTELDADSAIELGHVLIKAGEFEKYRQQVEKNNTVRSHHRIGP